MNTSIRCLLMIGILSLNSTHVYSQEKEYKNDKYVIVLDVQQYWTGKTLSEKASEEMLASINALIDKTDPSKIIYVKSIARVASLSFKGVKIDTVPNQDFDPALRIVNNTVFMKDEGDAFTASELTSFLSKNNVKEIILTGLLAEECVSRTAIGGLSRNYAVYIIPEAVGAKSEKSKKKSLEKLSKAGVILLN